MTDRDFTARPYSAEEQRVCDYLVKITDGAVGCGEDPIGFLIASHGQLVVDRARLAAPCQIDGCQYDPPRRRRD